MCIIKACSSSANEWELTGAKPKANTTVVRPPSRKTNVLDNSKPWQPVVKGIKSGEGPSAGLSLHGASYGDHMSDVIEGTLGCVLPPPEQGGRQTKDHGLQQPKDTQVSLQPGKLNFY